MHSAGAQHMDREFLLRQLIQAEQDVAESKAFVAEQQREIVELEREGHDCAKAIRRREAFLLIQQAREEDRAKILDELFGYVSVTVATTSYNLSLVAR